MEYCHCGEPLHYKDKNLERLVNSIISDVGDEYVNVVVDGRIWRVQRHYIALHGLFGKDVPTLGFQEVL